MSCSFWLRRKKRAAMLEKEKQREAIKATIEAEKQEEPVEQEEKPVIKESAKNGRRTGKKS